jgi:hypothetical protein
MFIGMPSVELANWMAGDARWQRAWFDSKGKLRRKSSPARRLAHAYSVIELATWEAEGLLSKAPASLKPAVYELSVMVCLWLDEGRRALRRLETPTAPPPWGPIDSVDDSAGSGFRMAAWEVRGEELRLRLRLLPEWTVKSESRGGHIVVPPWQAGLTKTQIAIGKFIIAKPGPGRGIVKSCGWR